MGGRDEEPKMMDMTEPRNQFHPIEVNIRPGDFIPFRV